MPRSKRPSFLTKQKEQQRRAKATEKREARRLRQKNKGTRPDEQTGELIDETAELEPGPQDPQ